MSLILSGTDGLSDIDGSAATPAIRGTDANTGIFFPAADTIAFAEGGAEAMRIDSVGRMIFGYTASIGLGNTTNIQSYSTGAQSGVTAVRWSNDATPPRLQVGKSRGATIGTNTIVQSGDALGGLYFYGDDGTDLVTEGASIIASVDGTPGVNDMPGRLTFNTTADGASSTTERMRIDSSGNLLVGTTSATGKFTVSGNAGASRVAAVMSNTASDAGSGALLVSKFDNVTTTSQVFVAFAVNNNAVANGQINANGASSVAFGSYSDSRLKENIVDLPSQLANIMALRPVEYDYIQSEGGGHQIGFIAQEVETVYPDLVGERADGMLTLTDLNKNDARLIKCIQEQQALITALTARITALETP